MHKHKCSKCGRVWQHSDDSFGDESAHKCYVCGAIQWNRYFGDDIVSSPIGNSRLQTKGNEMKTVEVYGENQSLDTLTMLTERGPVAYVQNFIELDSLEDVLKTAPLDEDNQSVLLVADDVRGIQRKLEAIRNTVPVELLDEDRVRISSDIFGISELRIYDDVESAELAEPSFAHGTGIDDIPF